jgi:hypothetical protein
VSFVKKLYLLIGLFMLGVLVRPGQANAQSTTRVVVNATAAPVFVLPDATMTPLRVAKEGSELNVITSEGDWYRVEFNDPQWGRRVGYIEKRHVSVMAAAPQQAVNLTVSESRPAQSGAQEPVRSQEVARQQQPATQPVQPLVNPTSSVVSPDVQPQSETPQGRVWVDVNFLSFTTAQDAQTYTLQTPKAGETAAFATAYPSFPRAKDLGVNVGFALRPGLGFKFEWSGVNYEYTVGLGVSIPHPTLFNRSATDGSATQNTLKRQDQEYDFSLMYIPAIKGPVQVKLFGGPSYFHVNQGMVGDIGYHQSVFGPINVVNITTYQPITVTADALGFNGGADVAYFFSRHVGVGGVFKASRASVGITEPLSGAPTNLKAGTVSIGAGLRLKF